MSDPTCRRCGSPLWRGHVCPAKAISDRLDVKVIEADAEVGIFRVGPRESRPKPARMKA